VSARPLPFAWLPGDACVRAMVAACLLAGALSRIVILDFGRYPYPPDRYWILEYNLRTQDVAGALLAMVLALAACVPQGRAAALGLAEAIGRRPWHAAAIAFVVLCLGALFVEQNHALAQDDNAALFQSRVFAAGRLAGQFPPEMVTRLVPPYLGQFLYASPLSGEVASAYWPGFALLLAPFSFAGAPWACNPLLACLALVLMGRLAARLSGDPRAAGWAMLLALASPAFTAMAITYFSMTAHLLFNLLFVWLLLEPRRTRLVLAGAVGSFALLLHNPVPHALFALPWLAWLAAQRHGLRNLLALAAGYLPLAVVVGFGWALLLSRIQGPTAYALLASDGSMLHGTVNFLWDWHVKLRSALAGPGEFVLAARAAEMARMWLWAVPGLPLLAAAGWWMARHDAPARLLGLSLACTLAGYVFVGWDQGHGWGARYLHPAWGALPVLAALALVRIDRGGACSRFPGYVAWLAVLSLVLATALRAVQIHGFLEDHLAERPPARAGARQVVFIAVDRTRLHAGDLIQNDPFLRAQTWYLISHGAKGNEEFMRRRFPGAQLDFRDRRGEVWRLVQR
jgi:hypothetical protein